MELLKMIEEVDSNDTTKLDEIDARVWCWLEGYKFAAAKQDRVYVLDENQCEIVKLNSICTLKYTRSRDALKKIRPKDWAFYTECQSRLFDLWRTVGENMETGGGVEGETAKTEELAELHAIIQAIEYERTNP